MENVEKCKGEQEGAVTIRAHIEATTQGEWLHRLAEFTKELERLTVYFKKCQHEERARDLKRRRRARQGNIHRYSKTRRISQIRSVRGRRR